MSREFTKVGVVGLGTMGAGIAEVFARNGLPVVAVELDEAAIDHGRGHIEHSTARAVARGKLTAAQQRALLERIDYGTDLDALADVDLVVEAVPEHLDLKRAIFARMDEICKPDTILATNTSSLSVTEIAVATGRPGKVVGLHFFNPAPVMKLVEVIRSVVTEQDVVDDVEAFAQKLGKVDVTIGDRAGFIANALLFGYLNHAAALYESRYATREDIDAAMKLGCGLPMGPLALLDLIGLDTVLRDPRHDVQADPRSAARADADLQADDHGRTARPEDRPRLLHATTRRIRPTVVEDAHGASAGAERPLRDGSSGRRRRLRDDGHRHRRGLRQGRLRRDVRRAQLGESRAGASRRHPIAGEGRPARQAGREDDRDAALAPDHRHRSGSTIWPTSHLVVEAVVEDLTVKQALFSNLDEICAPGTVLATTTSSLPVIECAAATSRPGDVIGMHFFNPAAIMQLVEVVTTVSTTPDVEATVLEVASAVGKHAVRCGDRAGFIVNALLFPYLNDAVKMLEAHYATADDIDSAMKVGCGYPMGPFELLDVVGNDVSLAIERELYQEFREPGFAPAPLLEHLVTAGRLGRKTGKGFRDYS